MPENQLQTTESRHLRLGSYVSRWWQELVHLDGPTWRCFRALVFSPGALAAAQCEPEGTVRARRYPIHPIRIYLTVNVLFFLLIPWISAHSGESSVKIWRLNHAEMTEDHPYLARLLERQIERSGAEDFIYTTIFDERMSSYQGALVLLAIPILGLASFLAFRGRRRYLVEHLVLATHLTSFFLISMLVFGLYARLLLQMAEHAISMLALAIGIFAWLFSIPATFYFSLRSFHEIENRLASLAFTAWMIVALFFGSWIYSQALFLLTLFSLRNLTFST